MVISELQKQLFKMLCHTTAYIFTSDELSYFDALLYVLQGYVTPSKCKYVAVLNNLKFF